MPETKLEAAERLLAEAEADIVRQNDIIADLQIAGHTTVGAEILLEMLKDARTKCRGALDLLRRSARAAD